MTRALDWVDSVGQTAFVFGLAWLVLIGVILATWHHRRQAERCDRCGGTWKRTSSGSAYHFCSPPRARVER